MAANTDRPNGFRIVRTRFGGAHTAQITKVFSTANDLFVGDLVKRAPDPVTSGDGVYPEVDRATATTDLIVGVVVGWEANPDALGNTYHAASSTYAVFVADIDNLVLEAQDDAATMVASDVGLNIDATFTAGDTTTGASGMELSGTSANTTAGLQFKIVGLTAKADNHVGVANARFLVTINQSAWTDQSVGV